MGGPQNVSVFWQAAVVGWLCMTSLLPARAQLNESDTAQFQLNLQATGMWQRGNVALDLLRGRAEMVALLHSHWAVKSQNNWLYQAFNGFKADNDLNSRNYLYYRPHASLYPFAMLYAQTNYRRKIAQRSFGGAGLSWQLLRRPEGFVKLSASWVYEQTNFNSLLYNESAYNGSALIQLWRPTFYVQVGWKFANGTRLQGQIYWQGGTGGVANNRFSTELAFEQALGKGWWLRAQASYQYEQVVARNIQTTDGIYSLGLTYHLQRNQP